VEGRGTLVGEVVVVGVEVVDVVDVVDVVLES
jgi:hypothetical protein